MSNIIQSRIKLKTTEVKRELNPEWPNTIQMEVVNYCNHKCEFCLISHLDRPTKAIDKELGFKIISEAAEYGSTRIGFTAGAEPLLSKHLDAFIEHAKSVGFKYVWITTNGTIGKVERWKKLLDAGLDSIKFSINAGDAETYKDVHGINHFDKVMQSLKYLSNLKTEYNFYLAVSSVLYERSKQSLEKFHEEINDLVDEHYLYPVINQTGQMPMYPSYRSEFGKCNTPFESITISANGSYRLCCGDMTCQTAVADLNKVSLHDAFYGKYAKDIRKKHIENKLKGTLCHRCIFASTDEVAPLRPELTSGSLVFDPKDFIDS